MKTLGTIVEIGGLIGVPAALIACAYFQIEQAALLTLLVVVVSLAIFFKDFEIRKPALRQIMPTVVLAALASAGRILFAPIPDFKPVSAICIISGAVFGRQCGFMVGALAALCSNFFFGQGPWTPWQMYAWGLIGYLSGVIFQRCELKTPAVLVGGFVSALLYGLILNSWYVVGYVNPLTLPGALMAFGAGLPFDIVHGIATAVFLSVLYVPWRRKLERIKRKYGL
ncbi:MAG: ECF transporter S component [Anaerotardibacter sp.]